MLFSFEEYQVLHWCFHGLRKLKISLFISFILWLTLTSDCLFGIVSSSCFLVYFHQLWCMFCESVSLFLVLKPTLMFSLHCLHTHYVVWIHFASYWFLWVWCFYRIDLVQTQRKVRCTVLYCFVIVSFTWKVN